MQLAAVEWFRLEGDDRGITRLGAADVDFAAKFHPGDGEDGACVRTRQCESVLLIMLQQIQTSCKS